jgi:MinD-like ATPase involved in chromosome partitioning or flagellar assembly
MDGAVTQSVVQQVPFTILAPRAPASRCLEDLVRRLLGTGRPPAQAAKTFWERVSEGPWRLM